MDPQKKKRPLGSMPPGSLVKWEGVVWIVMGHGKNGVLLQAAQDVPPNKLKEIRIKEALTYEQAQKAPPSGAQDL